jgi:hypothetical protein
MNYKLIIITVFSYILLIMLLEPCFHAEIKRIQQPVRYCKLDGKNTVQISLQILLDFFFLFDYQYTSVALKK